MSRGADSAGRPWEGRSFTHHDTAFGGDDGSAPPRWAAAVAALRAGEGGQSAVVDALRGERLLVPLLAAAGETGLDDAGRLVDKTQELSIVTVAGPDGAPILPMFASVAAMQAWDPAARPVPTGIDRAAAAALDGPGRVVVDPGGATEFVLVRTVLEALLVDRPWTSPLDDPEVQAAVLDALFAAPAVQGVVIASGDPASTLAGAELEAHALVDATPDAAAQVQRAAQALGESAVLRERVASLAVRLHRWEGGAPRLPLAAPAVVAVARADRP